MAETLGSLVDKLTIKDLRLYHLREMLGANKKKFSPAQIKGKISLVERQKKGIVREIDAFVLAAVSGSLQLKDEKVKLYNAVADMGKIAQGASFGTAISGLAQKNSELWHLEDEARRKDASLAFIGAVKKKIDRVNQQRNDYIDKIDELLEKFIRDGQ